MTINPKIPKILIKLESALPPPDIMPLPKRYPKIDISELDWNNSLYLPIKENNSNLFKLISKKPLVADITEINENIRSRSAKLRYATRNNSPFFYPNEFKNKFINYFKLEGGKIW